METNLDHSPLRIGCRVIPSRYFLAPLAGYTKRAFRLAVRELGGLGLATSDLVLAHTLLHGSGKSRQLIRTAPADKPLSIQLHGSLPEMIAEAARWLVDRGYEGIDLNMGCPMANHSGRAVNGQAKVIRKAGHTAALKDPLVDVLK